MTLTIENPNGLELDDFIKSALIPRLQETIVSAIDVNRLAPIEEYINTLNISNFGNHIFAKDVVISAAYNLISTRQQTGDYIISIDSTQLLPNTRAKIIDIMQLINYGTLATPAYPIIEEVFRQYSTMLNQLYINYERGG